MFLDQATGFGQVIQRAPRMAVGICWICYSGRIVRPRIRRDGVKEPRPVEMDVGEEKRHGAALGDLPSLVQVAVRAHLTRHSQRLLVEQSMPCGYGEGAPGAGEETAGEIVQLAGAAEAVHGGVKLGRRGREPTLIVCGLEHKSVERSTAQR